MLRRLAAALTVRVRFCHSEYPMALGTIREAKNRFVHEQRSEESHRETLHFVQGDNAGVPIS